MHTITDDEIHGYVAGDLDLARAQFIEEVACHDDELAARIYVLRTLAHLFLSEPEPEEAQQLTVAAADTLVNAAAETLSAATPSVVSGQPALNAAAYRQLREQVEPVVWRAYWETVYEGRPVAEVAEELGVSMADVFIYKGRVLRLLGGTKPDPVDTERGNPERAPVV